MPSQPLLTLILAAGFAITIAAGYGITYTLGHFLYRDIPPGRQRDRLNPRKGRGCLEWTVWNGAAAVGLGVGGKVVEFTGEPMGDIVIGAGLIFGFMAAGWFLQALYFLRKEAKAQQAAWVEESEAVAESEGDGGR